MAASKTNLVALRTEREHCVDLLSEAFAKDIIDVDEFERRIDLAHTAETVNAIVALRNDLEGLQVARPAADSLAVTPSSEQQQALALAQPPSGWCVGIMGAGERKGRWRVPKKMRVAAIMGGAELDFREAVLAPGVTTIHVFGCMGSVEVIVPPNVAVECNGVGIMGAFESMERCPVVPDLSQPLLRISGAAVMGAVEIHTRLVGETARAARKRKKREKKARRKQLSSRDS